MGGEPAALIPARREMGEAVAKGELEKGVCEEMWEGGECRVMGT